MGLSLTVLASIPFFVRLSSQAPTLPEGMTTAQVRRQDLSTKLTAGGRVDSSSRTVIDCKIENVEFRVRGSAMAVGGASTILSVVPEGTMVKKGDVLCVLDSSSYEELVRQQQMNVDRGRADYEQARLNHEVAKMTVQEYQDGLMLQTVKSMKGQIALSESDLQRAEDRLDWSRRMLIKGYLPKSQVKSDELDLNRMALGLRKGKTALDLFERYTAPKTLRVLESNVTSADMVLTYQKRRLERYEERLTFYKKQVENCTIRAPHDGFLVYANEDMKQIRIEPGMTVRTRQRLFYLPDLDRMEVAAMLHESVVKDVKPGQRARVRVEALAGRTIEGQVESVTALPMKEWFSDVKYFIGVIRLENVPRGLRPGMTAQVEVTTMSRPDVLVIPTEALTVEGGHQICYVTDGQTVERREITLGQSTSELLEVTGGLEEGDQVILDPTQVAGLASLAKHDS